MIPNPEGSTHFRIGACRHFPLFGFPEFAGIKPLRPFFVKRTKMRVSVFGTKRALAKGFAVMNSSHNRNHQPVEGA